MNNQFAVHTRHEQLTAEFGRQVRTLVQIGYPKLLGMAERRFVTALEPLRDSVSAIDVDADRIPFLIVVPGVAVEQALPLIELKGKTGFTTMEADDIARFQTIDGIPVPEGVAYLLTDVDTGKDLLNVTPDDALGSIKQAGRSPLTVAEGIAVVTQHPDILRSRNSFSLLASRCGDRRVPALWMSGGQPRLGWCWAGNPHTWLGSASCGGRFGA